MKSLPFLDKVNEELDDADALVVMARGLGMASALARFVVQRVQPSRLILALGVRRDIAVSVLWPAVRAAARTGNQQVGSLLLPRLINADYSARDRANVYTTGGFIIVSATVLVHDLLLRNIPTDIVDGIVVFAADRVTPSSNTHFALSIFREQNKIAFIKAFSENAPGLAAGFHNVERIMQSVFVSRLNLWPRFHAFVKHSLSRRTPDLVDLSVPLAPAQGAILTSLHEVATRILDDLRLATRALDLSDIHRPRGTGEAGPVRLVSNFDEVVRRQLVESSGSSRIVGGEKVRNLLADLTSVRALLSDAIDLNSVLFYQRIITFRHTHAKASYWLMRREAQHMLFIARSRLWIRRKVAAASGTAHCEKDVKGLKRPRPSKKRESSGTETIPILDPSPKWNTLRAVLEEIENDVRQIGPEADVGRVIVIVKDQTTLDELRHVLAVGAQPYLRGLLCNTLPSVAAEMKWERNCSGNKAKRPCQNHFPPNHNSIDDTLSCKSPCGSAFASECKCTTTEITTSSSFRQATLSQFIHEPGFGDSRKECKADVTPAKDESLVPQLQTKHEFGRELQCTIPNRTDGNCRYPDFNDKLGKGTAWPWPIHPPDSATSRGETTLDGNCIQALREYFGIASSENPVRDIEVLLWCVEWADTQGRGARLLAEFKPSFVVMYNADLAFVRQVEVFRAANSGRPIRLYLLAYDDVIDEDRYRNAIERESSAFKTLIRERATMVVQANQEGRLDDLGLSERSREAGKVHAAGRFLGHDRDSRVLQNSSEQIASRKSRIIVDTRELRSALPMLLYAVGISINPVTLEVGDFVLSRSIGIERKTFSDLVGSFSSGRLFNQANALCRHYRCPCLLIEGDTGARLSLAAAAGGIPSELLPSFIVSKMVLLIQQFPGLRLLWAQGPQDACELFAALKVGAEDPDETIASSLGVDSIESAGSKFNSAPATLLRSLPGIDGNNIFSVMRKVRNVSALLNMNLQEMTQALGNAGKAQKLFEFVNERPSEALAFI